MANCKNPSCQKPFKQYNSLQRYCSSACQISQRGKPKKIKQVSDKRKEDNEIYSVMRKQFLEKFPICFIENCRKPATTIEHRSGRTGYADDWARDNGITLFLDIRFWAPCCLEHNLELENNTELSKKYQLSRIHGGKKE